MAFLSAFAVRVDAQPPPAGSELKPALTKSDLDPAVFHQWHDGAEKPLADADRPQHIVSVRDARTGTGELRWSGVRFGDDRKPGPRHLRIGLTAPKTFGTILLAGGGKVSVLKNDAKYPGNLGDDSQWLAAERIDGRRVTNQGIRENRLGVWILPPGTKTRAVRISHDADITDKSYGLTIHGVVAFEERLANIAPQALVASSGNESRQKLLNNESVDGLWGAWDNWDERNLPPPVSESPAWITLVWPQPVPVRGLATLWTGFGAAEAQIYTGPKERHPREARDADWQTVSGPGKFESYYPASFAPQWLDFGKPATTRAIRLRMTKTAPESHPHLNNNTKNGRRVWLGDLLALQPLGELPLTKAILDEATETPPPIPIRFSLKDEGYVTLVIDDLDGKRIRNLVSETWYPAGENVAWWDGLDDLGRDGDAARRGVYNVPGNFVAPGSYRVRGLWGPRVDLRYEFPIYTEGNPAWQTADHTGGWLANHSPPSSALFVPGDRTPSGKPLVFLGSFVSEGTHGLTWVDLDGKVVGGMNWVGGNWTGAPLLARDDGPQAVKGVHAYAGVVWENNKPKKLAEVRLTALVAGGERAVIKHVYPLNVATLDRQIESNLEGEMGGLAAWNGKLFMSLRRQNQVIVVDATRVDPKAPTAKPAPAEVVTFSVNDPRGLAFDASGALHILSGTKLIRQNGDKEQTVTIIADGLDDPQQVTFGPDGLIYISDWGKSHQVKVFSPVGKLLRSIGKPGGPQIGAYDVERMHHPKGITVDDRGRLWVAERDEQPKRVSVWTPTGAFERAFYGPMEYGGGGVVDPNDPNRFYYLGMEFALDWKLGKSTLKSIYGRHGHEGWPMPERSGAPVTPIHLGNQQYFTNADHSNPTGGCSSIALWRMHNGIAIPCASLGRASDWSLLRTKEFAGVWPEKANQTAAHGPQALAYLWVDLNEDGVPQPDEVKLRQTNLGGVTVMPDLALVVSRFGDRTVRLPATRFTKSGVPVYDLAAIETVVAGVESPRSSGGDQALVHPDGWSVVTLGIKPYSGLSLSGAFKGQPKWSYPSLWPGLHASHEAPVPDRPGQLIGTTRLLGGFITPKGSDAGPLWIVNGNMGTMYVFTADGLFVRTLFRDFRVGRSWSMPLSQRGMLLNEVTSEGENFWPSVTQTRDGQIFLVDGNRGSLVRVDHLEAIKRLPDQTITVTAEQIQAAQAWQLEREVARQKNQGQETLKVALRTVAPVVDGKLDDWAAASWASIDKRGVRAWFNSDSKPYDVTAAVAIAGDRLYVAYRTGENELLRNSGEVHTAPFKTGGALDLMLGTDSKADPRRTQPVPGDLRLIVTLVPEPNKKNERRPLAVLYRAVVPGTADKDRVPFASPWRTVSFDRVDDVTKELNFASRDGNFEFSIPLDALNLKASPGDTLRGDLGVLRGNGFQTMQRVYWSNKATGIINDVPSEAALTPHLWGRWEFIGEPESPISFEAADEEPTAVSYNRDVQAVFSRLGCNGGQCHGAVQGKNGFRLSLFGGDPATDYDRLLHADGGRRLNIFHPEQSLLLQKATGQVAHQGGVRTSPTSPEYQLLRNWINAGAKSDDVQSSRITALKVSPAEKRTRVGESFPLTVEATFADGTSRDVTGLCSFESLDSAIVSIDEAGLATARGVGDTALIVRYRSDPVLARILVPRIGSESFPEVRPENFIDRHVLDRLKQLNIPPSPLADDATFLRRLSLDLTGALPSPQVVREFLADTRADKRARKIDELLARPGHAGLWTMIFSDILKASEWGEFGSPLSYEKEAARFQAWVRARLNENLPYDQFAERILIATSRDGKSLKEHAQDAVELVENAGPDRKDLELYSRRHTPDLYWQRHNSTGVNATLQVAHAFLGLRLECAQCHRHPNDTWQQDDLLSFANFFMGVRSIKQTPDVFKLYPELDVARKELEAESKDLQKKVKERKEVEGKKLDEDAKKAKAELEPLAKSLLKVENELIMLIARSKDKKADADAFKMKIDTAREQIASLRKTVEPLKNAIAANDAFNREMQRLGKRAEQMGNAGMRVLQTDIMIVKSPKFASVSSPIGTQTSKDFRLLGEAKGIEVPKDVDPRTFVAEWLRRPDNPYFARALVNRVWAHYFGRGIVDPPDNLSQFSPATHPELLKELSDGFIASGFDLRWLHRTIVSSRTYQQSSTASKANEMDRANYAYFPYRRLPAEVMIDVLSQATGVPEKMGIPEKEHLRDTMRAVELPFVPGNGFVAHMLETFGRPKRNGVVQCDCQRDTSTTMLQVLSLANHPRIWDKIADPAGLAAGVTKRLANDDERIEELFLTSLSRRPTDNERQACRSYLAEAASPIEGFQGILWSLMNTKEFLLQH